MGKAKAIRVPYIFLYSRAPDTFKKDIQAQAEACIYFINFLSVNLCEESRSSEEIPNHLVLNE